LMWGVIPAVLSEHTYTLAAPQQLG
jgi:hypothetical protein